MKSPSEPKSVGVFPPAAHSSEAQESDLGEDLLPSGASYDPGENAGFILYCVHALEFNTVPDFSRIAWSCQIY